MKTSIAEMKSIVELGNRLAGQYHTLKGPSLKWQIKGNHGEAFCCKYAGGTLYLEAASPQAAVFGLKQLNMSVRGGYLAESLGDSTPKFPLRALFLHLDGHTAKSWHQHISPICQRVLDLGYNSLIFSSSGEDLSFLEDIGRVCHDYGIKIFIKPAINKEGCSPLALGYVEQIRSLLNDFLLHASHYDGFFWEGALFNEEDSLVKEATQFELVRAEVTMLETLIGSSHLLIYSLIPKSLQEANCQLFWIPSLCEAVGTHTYIAFSALAGDPTQDHLPPHPLWETLKKALIPYENVLMPIFNVGLIQQGEGLWPSIATDIVDAINSVERLHFSGMIGMINHLPHEGGLLDCNLWTISQALWRNNPSSMLFEMWFKSLDTDLEYRQLIPMLKQVREITIEFSFFRSLPLTTVLDPLTKECYRIRLESILFDLKKIQMALEIGEKSRVPREQLPLLFDYFFHFTNDAKRFIVSFMHAFHVTSPIIRIEGEVPEGFWVSSNMMLMRFPHCGLKGSRKEAIYRENRLITLA